MFWSSWVATTLVVVAAGFPFEIRSNVTDFVGDGIVPWDLNAAREVLKRDIAFGNNYCAGQDLSVFQSAYQDVLAALMQASTTTTQLLQYLNTNPGNQANAGLTKQARLILYTFQIIYGQVLFEGSQTSNNQAGVGRVQSILNVINTMGNSMQGTINNLEVHCDENYLTGQTPATGPPPAPYAGWSSTAGIWIDKTCTRMGNTLGWCLNTVNAQTQAPVSIMTFCPSWFGTWSQAQLSQSWRQLQSTTFGANQVTLDHFKGNYLGETMAHEFSHAKAVLGNLDLVDAQPTPYSWDGVTRLAVNNPSAAITNADSFAYYIIALYFNNNSWLTGFSQFIF